MSRVIVWQNHTDGVDHCGAGSGCCILSRAHHLSWGKYPSGLESVSTILLLISESTAQTPLTNLFISLAFGFGQIVIGAAMMFYAARRKRWRQVIFFGLALIGAWIAASGLTELVVSGAEMLSRIGNSVSADEATRIRANADTAFFYASILLLFLGVGYPLLTSFILARQSAASASANSQDGNATNAGQNAEATAAETVQTPEPEG